MKKILILLSVLLLPSMAKAAFLDNGIGISSYTVTNETLASISSTSIRGGILYGVLVSSGAGIGSITLYDSNAVASNIIGVVSFNTAPGNSHGYFVPFSVRISSGLTYSISNNVAGGLSIIYSKGVGR